MSMKSILKAAFTLKNFALLMAVVIVSILTEFLPFTFIGLAGYIYFVMQTLGSPEFQAQYAQSQNIRNINALSIQCNSLYHRIYKDLDNNIRNKLKGVLKEKEELMHFFARHREDAIKQKIVEQALNLVISYLKLIHNYYLRRRELSSTDADEIRERLNKNKRKLDFIKEEDVSAELTKAVEMDEKLLESLKEEKNELERISVRLDYIESAFSTFKHKIVSSNETDPEIKDIESVVNEAAALDNVLYSNEKRDRGRFSDTINP